MAITGEDFQENILPQFSDEEIQAAQAELDRRTQLETITPEEARAELERRGIDVPPETEPNFPGAAIIEPLTTVATGLASQVTAGLTGAITAPFIGTDATVENIAAIQEAGTFQPRTEAGRAGLETVGSLIEKGVDIVNFPISGLAGIADLVSGQGLNKAVETLKSVQTEGTAKTLGQRTLEETGSPLAATIAEIVPEAVLLSLGVRKTPKGAADISPQRAKEIESILKASRKTGVDVLTTDIFAPKSIFSRLFRQFTERIPLVGTGGKRAAQQEQRVNALRELDEAVPRDTSEEIFFSLQQTRDKFKNAAGQRLNTFTERLVPKGQVPVNRTVESIDKAIKALAPKGRVQTGLIKDLQNLKQTALSAGEDFRMLRDFRTDARMVFAKVDPAGRSQLRSSDKVLTDNIMKATTKDLDDFVLANTNKRDLFRYKKADEVYRREAIKLQKTRLKTILDKGGISPEKVGNLLFSSTPSEVKLLFNNLDDFGRRSSRVALYRKALDQAFKGEVSPTKFINELNKLKTNFDVFFRGSAKAELEGLKRLMEATKRAETALVVTPTGQSLQIPAALAAGGLAGTGNAAAIFTLFSAATAAGAARVYESSGVRNLLIRLGKAEKRGTLEADLLKIMPAVLEEANRTLQEQDRREQ